MNEFLNEFFGAEFLEPFKNFDEFSCSSDYDCVYTAN